MSNDFPSRRAPDDLKSVEFARPDGSIRKITPKDGVVRATDPQDDLILASYGFAVIEEEPKAANSKTAKATAARKAKAEERRRAKEEADAAAAAEANREVGDPPAETTSEGTD